MDSVIYFGGVLVLLCLSVAMHKHRNRALPVYLELVTPTITVRSTQMQIQAQINTTQVFNVVAIGTQGERMTNVPMDFVLDNPNVADMVFDQNAMTLTLAFKTPGTSNLTETATGTQVSNTHTVTVTDIVASVDLEPQPPTA